MMKGGGKIFLLLLRRQRIGKHDICLGEIVQRDRQLVGIADGSFYLYALLAKMRTLFEPPNLPQSNAFIHQNIAEIPLLRPWNAQSIIVVVYRTFLSARPFFVVGGDVVKSGHLVAVADLVVIDMQIFLSIG